MARFVQRRVFHQNTTVACGATDQNNPIDLLVPSPNCTALEVTVTTKTAGTGTGTFSIQLTYGGTPTVVGLASATSFIDADAAAGTVHGSLSIRASIKDNEGARLGIKTVKSGTVSADATLILDFTWKE